YVIEPAAGADRAALTFMFDAYDEEMAPTGDGKEEVRTVLRFHPDIAPAQVAVLPLSRNAKLTPTARDVHAQVRHVFRSQYDDTQSIGRRYRRQDEIGTPLCVTVDFDSLEDDSVTIRDRDTQEQVRVRIDELTDALRDRLGF
ncbi:MAG: glycine--tRNA ligase, partial [Chloroflexi bacterium]|nr:glycine--tRNA ligase [Chloroflexota bacterium]